MTHDLAAAVSDLTGRLLAAGHDPADVRTAVLTRAEGLLAGRLGNLTPAEHDSALAAVGSAVDSELGRRLVAIR